jgi:hypothetical protein
MKKINQVIRGTKENNLKLTMNSESSFSLNDLALTLTFGIFFMMDY